MFICSHVSKWVKGIPGQPARGVYVLAQDFVPSPLGVVQESGGQGFVAVVRSDNRGSMSGRLRRGGVYVLAQDFVPSPLGVVQVVGVTAVAEEGRCDKGVGCVPWPAVAGSGPRGRMVSIDCQFGAVLGVEWARGGGG